MLGLLIPTLFFTATAVALLNRRQSRQTDDANFLTSAKLAPGTLVDVLYSDALTYVTVAVEDVEWTSRHREVALWRVAGANQVSEGA